jgi:hypothetical protein
MATARKTSHVFEARSGGEIIESSAKALSAILAEGRAAFSRVRAGFSQFSILKKDFHSPSVPG